MQPVEGVHSSLLSATGAIAFAQFRSSVQPERVLYFADTAMQIRRAQLDDGVISTVAKAQGQISSIASTHNGDLYFACGHSVCKWHKDDGSVITVAGRLAEAGSNDAQGDSARFTAPMSLAVDHKTGHVFVASDCKIRHMTSDGTVTTVAGSSVGHVDGAAPAAKFHMIGHIALDTDGSLFIADKGNNRIRKLDPRGNVSTVAGDGQLKSIDGVATAASFNSPCAVAVVKRWVFVLEAHVIRCIAPNGTVTTIAGEANQQGFVDGLGASARLRAMPQSALAMDRTGRFVFCDGGKNQTSTRLRQFLASVHASAALPASSLLQDTLALINGEIEGPAGGDVELETSDGVRLWSCAGVLGARSLYFRTMLSSAMAEAETKVVCVKAGSEAVRAALLYLHTDQLCVPDDFGAAVELLDLSTCWDLPRLRLLSEIRVCADLDDDNVSKLLALAEVYKADALHAACLAYACQNFAAIKNKPSFAELNKALMLEIVQAL